MSQLKRQNQAQTLRIFRKVHRYTGAFLFIFFFIIAITAVLLGWKKHSAEYIMPSTKSGVSADAKDFMPVAALKDIALITAKKAFDPKLSLELDRIDYRPADGIAKFIFKEHIQEIQLDASTGAVLSIGPRRADWIESLHDGSLVDNELGIPNGYFKLFYSTLTGIALLVFTITGFWLWYGPKRMKKESEASTQVKRKIKTPKAIIS